MLIALSSGIKADAIKKLPSEIRILPWGESPYNGGKLIVNSVSLKEIPQMQAAYNFDRIALDFNHNSLESSPSFKGEPLKVAAYASLEVRDGQGLFFTNIEWTKEGKEFVEGGHYGDISPTVKTNDKGEVIFVHSAALCRQGRIPGLELFSADFLTQNTKNNMEELLKKYKALLCTILNLPEDCEDAAIEDAAKKFAQSNKNPPAENPEKKEETAGLEALSSRIDAIEAAGQKKALIDDAIKQGKVIPANAANLPLDVLKELCATSPAGIVPMHQRTPEGVKAFSSAVSENFAQNEVCRQLGLTPEQINKYNN